MIQPPFLEVNNPTDFAQIKKNINKLVLASKKKHLSSIAVSENNSSVTIKSDVTKKGDNSASDLKNEKSTQFSVNRNDLKITNKTDFKINKNIKK